MVLDESLIGYNMEYLLANSTLQFECNISGSERIGQISIILSDYLHGLFTESAVAWDVARNGFMQMSTDTQFEMETVLNGIFLVNYTNGDFDVQCTLDSNY